MALVKVKGTVRPRSLVILAALANVAQSLTTPTEILITSGNDSTHMVGSLHYTDEAVDVRTKTFPTLAAKRAFVAAVLTRLGPKYQGFLEDVGGPNEHAHFEFDDDTRG